MSNRARFVVVHELGGVRRYIADGTIPAVWTEDRARAKVWKLRAWAEQRAADAGGQVFEVHRVEADPAKLPHEVLAAELVAAHKRIAELEAAITAFLAVESSDAASGGEFWYALVVSEAVPALRAVLEKETPTP